jgi:putative ABC transport system substrate-binding protein
MTRSILAFSLALCFLLLSMGSVFAQKQPTIGFLVYSDSGFAQAEQKGIVRSLEQAGFVDGKTAKFIVSLANGDITTADNIAQGFVEQRVDLIISIGTPSTQAAVRATQTGKAPIIVFAGLTDPFAAGIAKAPCDHPTWITGTQALDPFEESVALITKVKPGAKTIGFMYSLDEANAVIGYKITQPLIEKAGMKLVAQTVSQVSDISGATKTLVNKKVDAIYVIGDNTVNPAMKDLLKVSTPAKIPVISTNPDDPALGAVVGLGVDYEADGAVAGRIAGLILNKKLDVSKSKISRAMVNRLVVNLDVATETGVTIPEDILKRSVLTIKDGKPTVSGTPLATATLETDEAFLKNVSCQTR